MDTLRSLIGCFSDSLIVQEGPRQIGRHKGTVEALFCRIPRDRFLFVAQVQTCLALRANCPKSGHLFPFGGFL